MSKSRALSVALLLALLVGAGCAGRVQPPYPRGQAPAPQVLIDTTPPRISALQVPKAKVRLRGLSATLMYAAQSPDRFAGTITVAGNELVTLGVHEDAYGLRYLSDEGLAPGYYAGPPSACAVAALIGVSLEPDELVELLLGGAPLIDGKVEVLDQRWDKKRGHELLRIGNGRLEQEIRYAWERGAWVVAGVAMHRVVAGGKPAWMWTVRHDKFDRIDGHVLPSKTVIRRPTPRGDEVLVIRQLEQRPEPSSLVSAAADPTDLGPDTWDDGGGWEDDGWEDGEAEAEAAAEVSEPSEPATPAEGTSAGAKAPIPAVFVIEGTGLTPRGDLCAGGGGN